MSRHFLMVIRTVLPLLALLSGRGHAFYADGFWSGMTPQQLAATATAYGLVVQPGTHGQWFVGMSLPGTLLPRLLGVFGFCDNYLVSYTRNIYSDADYANTLATIFATYGPPRKMNFGGNVAATGTGEGWAIRAIGETEWRQGIDRVRMVSYFDWRLYRGDLQRDQPASVRFETFSPCTPASRPTPFPHSPIQDMHPAVPH